MPLLRMGNRELHWVGTAPAASQVPLVLIHGAGGNHSHWMAQLAYLRSRGLPAMAFDLPGHGRSPGEALASIAAYADIMGRALESVLADAPAGTQLAVAGHSMGGAIALELALSRPSWLAGVALIATGARLRVLPSLLESFQKGQRDLQLLRMAYGPSADSGMLCRAKAEYTQVPVPVLYHDYLACDAFDRLREVAGLQLPTVVICGTEDALTPPKFSTFLAEQMGGQLVLVPGAGHMVMLERPEAVNTALERFLRGLGNQSQADADPRNQSQADGDPRSPDHCAWEAQDGKPRAPKGSEAGTCA